MARKLLLALLALASCSKGPQSDLPAISQARSLAAEWALVNEQARLGHLTGTYVRTMRHGVREQLKTLAASLKESHSPYGSQIALLIREPDDAAPQVLRHYVLSLKRQEDALESA